MNQPVKFSVFIVSCLLATPAMARGNLSLHLEPYMGFGVGNFSWGTSLGFNESDVKGFAAGFRAGLRYRRFFIAPDLMWNKVSFDPTIADPNFGNLNLADKTANVNHSFLGISVGCDIPLLPLRVWGGVGKTLFQLKFNADNSDAEFEGTGYKVGLGYKPSLLVIRLPLSFNLEYMVNKLDKVNGIGKLGGGKVNLPALLGSAPTITQYAKPEIKTLFVTLSVPFSLFGSK